MSTEYIIKGTTDQIQGLQSWFEGSAVGDTGLHVRLTEEQIWGLERDHGFRAEPAGPAAILKP